MLCVYVHVVRFRKLGVQKEKATPGNDEAKPIVMSHRMPWQLLHPQGVLDERYHLGKNRLTEANIQSDLKALWLSRTGRMRYWPRGCCYRRHCSCWMPMRRRAQPCRPKSRTEGWVFPGGDHTTILGPESSSFSRARRGRCGGVGGGCCAS